MAEQLLMLNQLNEGSLLCLDLTKIRLEIVQIKCDGCESWMHQICCDIKVGTVTDSFNYLCPECKPNTKYA